MLMGKINFKVISGIGIAVVMGIATFIGTITDQKKEKQIDELIEKVNKLTDKET